MELKRYLQVVSQRWTIVVGVTIVTVLFTAFFVSGASPVYESTGLYLILPRELEPNELIRATDALNRGAEINSTYARIARSDVVKARAKDDLRADGVSTSGFSVRTEVLPGTNIIEIAAKGDDAEAAAAYATAIGDQAIAYLDEVGEVYQLQLLDEPEASKNPISSNRTLTMIVGLFFGVMAGAVVAFSVEYFSESIEGKSSSLQIYDKVTGAYNSEFFRLRLRQEMNRCNMATVTRARWKVRQISFSLGVMRITVTDQNNGSDSRPRPADLRDAAQALLPRLRLEDLLAYLGDDTFVVLLPDMPVSAAEELLNEWSENLASAGSGRGAGGPTIHASVGVCENGAEGLLGDEESVRIAQAL